MVTVHSAITPRGMSDFAGFAGSSVSAVRIVFSLLTNSIVAKSAFTNLGIELGYHGDSLINKISTLLRPLRRPLTHRESIGLVFFCTLIGAAAQVLMKIGAHNLPAVGAASLIANP